MQRRASLAAELPTFSKTTREAWNGGRFARRISSAKTRVSGVSTDPACLGKRKTEERGSEGKEYSLVFTVEDTFSFLWRCS